jgi:uncharacterized integral membrane protein
MRSAAVLLILVCLAATVFALSNTTPVTVMFWQWPIYTGSLALAIVGAGILGALLTFLPSMARHAHLAGRLRDLERRLAAHQAAAAPVAPDVPPATAPPASHASSDLGQTRRLW